MDLKLTKLRLTDWARRLASYLQKHQQVEIKHTHAISAIAAMLGEPNANTLTTKLREQSPSKLTSNDKRTPHYIHFHSVNEPDNFEAYARLTTTEASYLHETLTEIAEDKGEIEGIEVFPSNPSTIQCYADLSTLAANALKTKFNHELSQPWDNAAKRLIPTLITKTSTQLVEPQSSSNGLSSYSNYNLIEELRRRDCLVCVFDPNDAANLVSRHPWVRQGFLSAQEADPDALEFAADRISENEKELMENLTEVGSAMIHEIFDCYSPDVPDSGSPIYLGADEHFSYVDWPCRNQPWLSENVFRVMADSGQILHVTKDSQHNFFAVVERPDPPQPEPGTSLHLPGAPDAQIVVDHLAPALQQTYWADEIVTIIDQYDNDHLVQLDAQNACWEILRNTEHLD